MFIEYTGRWEISETGASTTACGSSLRAGFYGETALLTFDLTGCEHPYPHVYVSIDGGAMTESVIAHYIRVRAEGDGPHEVSVIMKSSPETQDRWESPVAKVVFTGIAEADPAPVKADARPIIEFVGDSITEGSSIYPELTPFEGDRWLENLLYTNDVCSSYSYLTAKLLGWRGEFMGYGSTGVTCSGGGGVPPAAEALIRAVPITW